MLAVGGGETVRRDFSSQWHLFSLSLIFGSSRSGWIYPYFFG